MERRIVICAPTGQDAALTSRVFGSVGIGSMVCRNMPDLLEQLGRGAGALLLVEEVISGMAVRPLADYVAARGVGHYDLAMETLSAMTRRFTRSTRATFLPRCSVMPCSAYQDSGFRMICSIVCSPASTGLSRMRL